MTTLRLWNGTRWQWWHNQGWGDMSPFVYMLLLLILMTAFSLFLLSIFDSHCKHLCATKIFVNCHLNAIMLILFLSWSLRSLTIQFCYRLQKFHKIIQTTIKKEERELIIFLWENMWIQLLRHNLDVTYCKIYKKSSESM